MATESKNILLVSPPNPFLLNPRSVPRIGLLYLGTVLSRAGHRVMVRHLGSLSELAVMTAETDFDFIGVSATTREYLDAVQILNYLKRERSCATVAIGGPHATALPEECLRNGFDLVVVGEADDVIADLVERRSEQPSIFRCGFVRDLDHLPLPDLQLLDDRDAWLPFLYLGQEPGLRTISILLSRGCPYHCPFCGPHFLHRRRSSQGIAAELRLRSDQGYAGLVILDDLPFVSEEQVRTFCRLIGPLGMKFRCNFRPNLLTPRIASLLAKAGCRRIQLGIESATQTVLDSVKHGIRTDANGRAIAACREHGVQCKAMFIWGLPGDGPETAEAIVRWVESHRPDSIQVSCLVPLPGSPFWDEGDHRRVTDYHALSFFTNRIGSPPDELSALRDWILAECAAWTHIDTGLPVEIDRQALRANPVQSKPA